MANWRSALASGVIACVAVVAGASAASAQYFSWTGFYVGAHVGASINDTDYRYPLGNNGGTGFAGGLQAGYNAHDGMFVYGLEGDLTWRGGSETSVLAISPTVVQSVSSEPGMLGTVRARMGFL